MTMRYGASVEEWINFSLVLGLTSDLLPVVANPNAVIGEHSKLKALGKTPSRYNWRGGDPSEFILLDEAAFSALWLDLEKSFGIEPSTESHSSDRKTVLQAAAINDPIAQFLHQNNLVLSTERDGRIHLLCPFAETHTNQLIGSESATTYFPRFTGGYSHGFVKCFHAHCQQRSQQEFLTALGITAADDFTDNTGGPVQSAV